MKCIYCERDEDATGYVCWGTRCMETFAIEGDDSCYEQLKMLGGGEKGIRYIDLNHAAWMRRQQEARLSPPPSLPGARDGG